MTRNRTLPHAARLGPGQGGKPGEYRTRTGFGNPERPALDDLPVVAPDDDELLLAMNEALERFAKSGPRKAELVRLHYFGGLDFEAAAEVLAVAVPTAKHWMAYARAWLKVDDTSSYRAVGVDLARSGVPFALPPS